VFGVTIAVFTISMIFAGRIQERRGPRPVAMMAGLLFGCGYLVGWLSGGSFFWLLIGFGILVGTGTGFGYVCPLATCVRWFPQHKGLITGVSVAGFGGGAILLSGIAGHLLARNTPVLEVFRLVGLSYGAAVLIGGAVLRFPSGPGSAPKPLIPVRELLKHPEFRVLFAGMFAGTFGGLLVVGNLGPMALAAGLPAAQAVLAIQVFAAGNAAGRIGWGWLYDRQGRAVIPISLLALMLAVVALGSSNSVIPFAASAAVAGFCFGACFVLYASQVASTFAPERLGSVYPFVFLAYGLSGLSGPAFGGWIQDLTGGFTAAIIVAAIILAAGAIAVWTAGKRAPAPTSAGRVVGAASESEQARKAEPAAGLVVLAERLSEREGPASAAGPNSPASLPVADGPGRRSTEVS